MKSLYLYVFSIISMLIALISPVLILEDISSLLFNSTEHTVISMAVEKIRFTPFILLLVFLEACIGFFSKKMKLSIGLIAIIPLYANALWEIFMYRTSHNLWPIEFIFYSLLAIPAVIGVYIGVVLREKVENSKFKTQPNQKPKTGYKDV
ncbi:MAG: hypothetical protein GY820_28795 [Gammaproteobacteria bacterium]|nr:hypothetical protein [Gammaproteobacteria bacterium]